MQDYGSGGRAAGSSAADGRDCRSSSPPCRFEPPSCFATSSPTAPAPAPAPQALHRSGAHPRQIPRRGVRPPATNLGVWRGCGARRPRHGPSSRISPPSLALAPPRLVRDAASLIPAHGNRLLDTNGFRLRAWGDAQPTPCSLPVGTADAPEPARSGARGGRRLNQGGWTGEWQVPTYQLHLDGRGRFCLRGIGAMPV